MPFKYNALLGLGLDNTIPLDGAGKIPSTYLPSYVDDVEEYNNLAAFPATGETGKIYVAIDTGFAYRWSGSVYVQIGITAAAGATTQVQFNDAGAFGGDSGLTFNKTTDALSAGGFIPTSSTVPANGVYLPAANSVAVATNGQGRLFVDATGNVGVGTSSTIDLLTIGGVASPRLGIQSSTAGGDGGIEFGDPGDDNVGFIVYDHSVDALRFGVNASERLRITSAGLVGIGTSAPTERLEVTGNVKLSSVGTGTSAPSHNLLFFGTTSAGSQTDQAQIHSSTWSTNSNGGNLQFYTSNASNALVERVRIDGAGNVGIGTTSPGSLLQLGGATNKAIRIDSGSSNPGFAGVFNDEFNISINRDGSNGAIANSGKSCANIQLRGDSGGSVIHFSTAAADNTAPSERFRCDSSGRLLIGTSTELAGGSSTTLLQVAASTGGLLAISRSGATTNAGDTIGEIAFFDNESGNDKCAAILCAGDLDHASGDKPSRLVFSVTADAASSPTEALRISSNRAITVSDGGNVVLGTTTGTKIGTATTQKLGFYNATPVVQPTAVADATDAATVITQLNDLLAKLRTLGIIAT